VTKRYWWTRASCRVVTALGYLALVAQISYAQGPAKERITRSIDDPELARLPGNLHPLARPQFDRGKVADSMPMSRVTLFFKLSANQRAGLDQLLSEQHDRLSPNYHRWLTSPEFGSRFGLSQGDLGKIVSWLESRGFTVQEVPASRNAVSFSGSAAQVAAAFHTEIHRYALNGEQHYANSVEPSVPGALADVVSGIVALNDFRPKPKTIRRTMPLPTPTLNDGSGRHFLAPDDFATIYDVKPLYARAIDGTGQRIAVVGQSDIQLDDIDEFRRLMGLPINTPQVVLVPGSSDPGMRDADVQEAGLDLEWAGAVARNANLIYVNSSNAWDSMQYAITKNLAPVVSVSFSVCEPELSKSDVLRFTTLG
jgi:subtilase family serine protease